jgi:hypothetical protein
MHATDLVGINGITRVLLVHTCQQGVYPRGHVLPLRLPQGSLPQILLHWTNGFTSSPKEVVQRIFITLKIHLPWPGLNREPWVQWQAL